MSTGAIVNPFDAPLKGQADGQATPLDTGVVNPFDAPLKAEAPPSNPEQDASNTRQMMVSGLTGMPTPNMNAADRASFEQGKAAGAITAGAVVPASAIGLSEVAPVIAHLAENLPNLDKAWKIVKIVGGAEYSLQHLKDVLKVLGGGSNKDK
jgi:hypothetical protein